MKIFGSEPRNLPLDEEDPEAETLFDGNVLPPEYYREGIQSLDLDEFKRKEYSKGTEKLIVRAESQWRK